MGVGMGLRKDKNAQTQDAWLASLGTSNIRPLKAGVQLITAMMGGPT